MKKKKFDPNKLKPCPFCCYDGDDPYYQTALTVDRMKYYYYGCRNPKCGVMPRTRVYDNPDDAMRAWNKREKEDRKND